MCEHVCTCVSMCEHAVIYRFGVLFRYAVTCLEPPKTLFQHLLAHHDRSQSQYVIWRYDSPAMGVLDADEAELICAAQIADFLSLPARVVAPPWIGHMGWAGELVEEVD